MSRTRATAGLVLLLLGRTAFASEVCTGPVVAIEAKAAERWPTAADVVRQHVEALSGVDRCARIDLVAGGTELVVVVTLRDGRTAVRRVARVEELADAIDALLLVPEATSELSPHAEEPAKPAASATATVASVSVGSPSPSASSAAASPVTSPPPPLPGFEVGLGATGRASGGPLHATASVSAHASLILGVWRIGAVARTDLLDAPIRGVDGARIGVASSALGLVAGERFPAGWLDLDLMVGFAIVAQQQLGREQHAKEDQLAPRLLASVRASCCGASIRPYVALETELGSPRSEAPPAPFTDWPFWSAGLTLGLSWNPR